MKTEHDTSHGSLGGEHNAPQSAKDPVCGMQVNPDSAHAKEMYGGKTYYFCSEHCLKKFRARPADYAV